MSEQPPLRPEAPKPARRPRKPLAQALEENAPYLPADYDDADVGALQALKRGDAPPHLQQRALDFIMFELCKLRDDPYRPNSTTDTAYACGKQKVGREIGKLLSLNLQKLRNKPSEY